MKKLADDSALRAKLSQMGYQQAAKFTWDKTACQMIEVFNKGFELGRKGKP
jgi:hypothetical protein